MAIPLLPLLAKFGAWALGGLKALLALVLKYPLQAVIALMVVVVLVAGHRIHNLQAQVDQQTDAIEEMAKTIATRTTERDAALEAIEAVRRTVRIQSDELARRDREDERRRKVQADQVAKAQAARRDAEAVARNAIAQLEQAARRRPSCAALLDADLRAECGL